MSANEEDITDWPNFRQAREALLVGTGAGVKIAVIDSGVEKDHPRLSGMKTLDAVSFSEDGGRIVLTEEDHTDAYGHGTAVASIIHEVAPEAEVGSFRVIDGRSVSRTHLICAGVAEAIKRGYHILNCSFGCRGLAKFILPHKEWADLAWQSGIHVVAACSNADASEAEWPSHFTSVIGVELADTQDNDIYFRRNQATGFSARGENVEVAWKGGGIQTQTGTSFAAPRVTGMMARILSRFPDTSPAMMHHLLAEVAEPWHADLEADW
ncbi:S8 family serine peptidase [Verrucomicrobiales bacterium]|nr:S8 family serine peptidase [Verrucomicrobiales bacterium]